MKCARFLISGEQREVRACVQAQCAERVHRHQLEEHHIVFLRCLKQCNFHHGKLEESPTIQSKISPWFTEEERQRHDHSTVRSKPPVHRDCSRGRWGPWGPSDAPPYVGAKHEPPMKRFFLLFFMTAAIRIPTSISPLPALLQLSCAFVR